MAHCWRKARARLSIGWPVRSRMFRFRQCDASSLFPHSHRYRRAGSCRACSRSRNSSPTPICGAHLHTTGGLRARGCRYRHPLRQRPLPRPARGAVVPAARYRRVRTIAVEAPQARRDDGSERISRCCTTIHTSRGNAGWQLRASKDVNARRGVICGDRNSMLQAALAGQGVALTSGVFAANDLATGRLVQVFSNEVRSEFAIYAVCLPRRLNDPLISGTMEWLAREATTSPDAHVPAP